MEQRDLFGFLPCKWDIKFDGGLVAPVAHCDEVEKFVLDNTNEDGFMYQPLSRIFRVNPATMEKIEEIPKTERPALLHRLPASHELLLYDGPQTVEAFRKGPGGFIIHLLAYILGTRLQFYDWWFDGRIPIESTHNIFITKPTIEDFLSHSYNTWKKCDDNLKRLFINVLYIHSKSSSYEWEWERFAIEYMVFDCCFKLANDLRILKSDNRRISHSKRIESICNEFKIPYEQELVKDIIKLRNAMFHEALWDCSNPCLSSKFSKYNQLYADHLRRLNKRIIPYLLGYRTPYINTGWWFLGKFSFDKPNIK